MKKQTKKPAAKAASKPKAKTAAKKPVTKVASKKAAKPAKKAAPAKPVKKAAKPAKPVAKKPVKKTPAPKKAPEKKAAVKKAAEKKSAAKKAPEKKVPAKAEKKAAEKAPAKKGKEKEEPKKKRGKKGAEEGAAAGFAGDEPNEEALAAAAAEIEPEVVKKPKPARRRRVRQLPRVPASLRTRPAWAEAWTALAEAGLDAGTIPKVLRDASVLFIGLGELSPQTTEALFHVWEIAEAPGGISSILEEAFLSQPPQAERKSTLESYFKEALKSGGVEDALILMEVARHTNDYREAARRLKAIHSPHADNSDLFAAARETVT